MEFSEVMKQARRMCAAYTAGVDCDICPIWYDGCMLSPCRKSKLDAHWLEKNVMAWAKANPEPVYPSWKEWHQATFSKSIFGSCPNEFGCPCPTTPDIADRNDCARCVKQPIPAEIAEKLGIKPVVREGEP